jgi:hypothetical protein
MIPPRWRKPAGDFMSEPIEVTAQMLNDVGLNPWAFELAAESLTRKKDFAEWTGPLTFIFKGIKFTLEKP